MWCPNQECPDALETGSPAELRDEIRNCPFCGSALVSSMPDWAIPEPKPDDPGWIPVLPITQNSWVPLVKSLLDSAEVRYVIKDEGIQHMVGWGTAPSGFNPITGAPVLLVHGDDADKAKDLLADFTEAAQETAAQAQETADQNEGSESGAPTESESRTPIAEPPTRCNACGEDLQSGQDEEPLTYCYHCGASLASS